MDLKLLQDLFIYFSVFCYEVEYREDMFGIFFCVIVDLEYGRDFENLIDYNLVGFVGILGYKIVCNEILVYVL